MMMMMVVGGSKIGCGKVCWCPLIFECLMGDPNVRLEKEKKIPSYDDDDC